MANPITEITKRLNKLELKVKLSGVWDGIVTSVNDPENQNRVKVSIPAIFGKHNSVWAKVNTNLAGNGFGFSMPPEVGNSANIMFQNLSESSPIVIGYKWSGDSSLPDDASKNNRVIETPSGHKINLDDSGKIFEIEDANGNNWKLKASGWILTDKWGNIITTTSSSITIQDQAGVAGKITVSSSGIILGQGLGGIIACVGTNFVTTMLGPQPILPGVNQTNVA